MRANRAVTAFLAACLLCFPAILGNHSGLSHIGPAQAENARPRVGDVMPRKQIKVIQSPGRYGLGSEPKGSKYAIVGGTLVRIDAQTGKILSILRTQAEPLD
jgi:hypothetical protein